MHANHHHIARRALTALALLAAIGLGACDDPAGAADPPDTAATADDASASTDSSPADDATPTDSVESDGTAQADSAALDLAQPDLAEPPDEETAWLYDDFAEVRHIDVVLSPEALAELEADPTDETYVRGAVEFQGERYDNVGVRYAGAYGSLYSCVDPDGTIACRKLHLKLSFNRWNRDQRFHGVRKLQLHGCPRDPTCLRERLAYQIYRDVGIKAARAVHTTVSVNGEYRGTYVLVEHIDKEFLKDNFPDPDGNLYKEVWPDPIRVGEFASGLETNEEAADVSRLEAFTNALWSAPESETSQVLGDWIDLDAQSTYNAVDQLLNNWDGIWRFYCFEGGCANHNYYIYETAERFVVVPWDMDHTFTEPEPDMARSWSDDGPGACDVEYIDVGGILTIGVRAPQCDRFMAASMTGPRWVPYLDALRSVLDTPGVRRQDLLARLDRYRAQLRPIIEDDPTFDLATWDADVARLRQIIRAQYDAAEALLAEP